MAKTADRARNIKSPDSMGLSGRFRVSYHSFKKDELFVCIGCKTVLFDSKHKFDSGTGWPSFYQPFDSEVLGESEDNRLELPRTEVHCKRCRAHLGHVFEDAPKTPTGLRYCINSIAWNLWPEKMSKPPPPYCLKVAGSRSEP